VIPYGRQHIDEADIQAVTEVLRSDFLTQGPAIECFERAVADYCGAKYAVAVSNATAALHLACLAAGLGPGDRLWTSPITFVASANCGLYCGASVDFVDIDPDTGLMSVSVLADKLDHVKANGEKSPKVIIPVHLTGQSCDMAAIRALADAAGSAVIEDAAHAIGGSERGRKIGACEFSDMTVFSFHPVKIVTTGEGGMILTNRADLYETLVLLRSHGITRDPARMEAESPGSWYYEQIALGFNYRMTDIQAALGASQMTRIDEFVARRRQLADRYDRLLAEFPLIRPGRRNNTESAWHLYTIRLSNPLSRREVFERLRAAGIGVNVHYIPVHTQPHYRRLGFLPGDFPRAEAYYEAAISLPLYYDLSEAMQDQVVEALGQALHKIG
jgi:UDP-4-amino-4,6-dideoxy-N-acetyl-beta-L-altrosamine transaminase